MRHVIIIGACAGRFMKYKFYFISLCILNLSIMLLILLNHTNLAFWFQTDHTWAPNFVYDIVYQHHSIYDWQLANGTDNLLDTLPFFIFSIFTDNLIIWIYLNAILNLLLYYFIFICLAKVLFKDIKMMALFAFSCFISLLLIASFNQINFTLDALLITGEHTDQILIGMLCLMLVMKKIENPINKWYLPWLFLITTAWVFSNEIFIAAIIFPLVIGLIILWFRDSEIVYIELIGCLGLAALIGHLIWAQIPLAFIRFAVHNDLGLLGSFKVMYYYFVSLYHLYPTYLICLFASIIVCLGATWHALKYSSNQYKLILYVLLVTSLIALAGIGQLFINYHATMLYLINNAADKKSHLFALTRDMNVLFIIPLFIGIPTALAYGLTQFNIKQRNQILLGINLLLWSFAIVTLIHLLLSTKDYTAPHKKIQNEQSLMQCVQQNIDYYHLHTGVSNFWITRPIYIMTNAKISLIPLASWPKETYEHYLSTWAILNNQNIDYWIDSYRKFSHDPSYTDYYNEESYIKDNVKLFGKPDGEFSCTAKDGHGLHAYFYRKDQIMQAILPDILNQGKIQAHVHQHKIILGPSLETSAAYSYLRV